MTTETRNLVVGCDGTWNELQQTDGGTPAPTNVAKLMHALADDGDDRQVLHYEEGVGGRKWEALRGGIYGYGLEKRILGSYRFLRNAFADKRWSRDQNRIFLFGFSRGAYTARRISGLLAHSGIPVKAKDAHLGWELYRRRDAASAKQLKAEGRFFDVPVEMVGVWDTVKATNDEDYHDTKLASNVRAGYHAMAIDEQRKFFPVLKWRKNKAVSQVWFAGAHSDVGGGYAKCGLSDVALEWMIYRALRHGLEFDADYIDANVTPDPKGVIHESHGGGWRLLGVKRRSLAKSELFHPSVKKRSVGYRKVLPEPTRYWHRA